MMFFNVLRTIDKWKLWWEWDGSWLIMIDDDDSDDDDDDDDDDSIV
jgi:hypothetical protein